MAKVTCSIILDYALIENGDNTRTAQTTKITKVVTTQTLKELIEWAKSKQVNKFTVEIGE